MRSVIGILLSYSPIKSLLFLYECQVKTFNQSMTCREDNSFALSCWNLKMLPPEDCLPLIFLHETLWYSCVQNA